MKKIYFSINSDLKNINSIEDFPSGESLLLQSLVEDFDVSLVHPREYDFNSRRVMASYGINFIDGEISFHKKKDLHVPEGDLFIIYSDGGSHNLGLDFMKKQYDFLSFLEENTFSRFFNKPEAEEKTLKNHLESYSKTYSDVARTLPFSKNNFLELLSSYGSVVLKPIAGCKMAGVNLLSSQKDLSEIIDKNDLSLMYLSDNYILQEPLIGDEKRLLVIGGKYVGARVHKNRQTPWNQTANQTTSVYLPSSHERGLAESLAKEIGADYAGVDFIGNKINEINGSGTDGVLRNNDGSFVYNHTDEIVTYIRSLIK